MAEPAAAGPWLIVLCSLLCAQLLSQQPGFLAVYSLSVLHSCLPHKESTISHRHQIRGELSNLRPGCTIPHKVLILPGPILGTVPALGASVRDFNPAETFGYLNLLISKSVCDTDRPCYLMPRNPTKGARTDAATTALGGGGHRTEGHESRPWHMKPIVPAVVVLGLSAPVLQGCWARGTWSAHGGWAHGLANSNYLAGKQQGREELHSYSPGIPPFILSSLEMTWGLSCRWLAEVFTQMRGRPGTGAFLQNGLIRNGLAGVSLCHLP